MKEFQRSLKENRYPILSMRSCVNFQNKALRSFDFEIQEELLQMNHQTLRPRFLKIVYNHWLMYRLSLRATRLKYFYRQAFRLIQFPNSRQYISTKFYFLL